MTGEASRQTLESFAISQRMARFLVAVYAAMLAGGCVVSILAFNISRDHVSYFRATMVGVAGGSIGGGAYYARRLYRAGIQGRLNFSHASPEYQFGVTLYMFIRPIVSVVLGLLSVVALLGALATGNDVSHIKSTFLFTAFIAAFTSGYASGRLLTRFDGRVNPLVIEALSKGSE